jgi:hypothetical protein
MAAAAADAVVVQDIPLLVEGGMAAAFALTSPVARRRRTARAAPRRAARDARAGRPVPDRRAGHRRAAPGGRGRLAGQLRRPGRPARRVDALWDDRLVPFEENLRRRRTAGAGSPRLADPDGWAGGGRPAVRPGRVRRGASGARGRRTPARPPCPGCPRRTSSTCSWASTRWPTRTRSRTPCRTPASRPVRRSTGTTRSARLDPVAEALPRHRRPGPDRAPARPRGRLARLALRAAVPRLAARRPDGLPGVPGAQAGGCRSGTARTRTRAATSRSRNPGSTPPRRAPSGGPPTPGGGPGRDPRRRNR